MAEILFRPAGEPLAEQQAALQSLLAELTPPFAAGASVGIKIHWGERGNRSFLSPALVTEVVRWVQGHGGRPFLFDTTVLYSGGRRSAAAALETARKNGFAEEVVGCPVIVADGPEGRDVVDLPAGYPHFATVQVCRLVQETDAFVIFSHFKGHLVACFGGAIKNLSMGFASRAQKQRMHADAVPVLKSARCTRCGACARVCPTGAARQEAQALPTFDLQLCIGCAQCIAQCPEVALQIHWGIAPVAFQERLVETAAAVWRVIGPRTVLVNALLNITEECDCMPGRNPRVAENIGFYAGWDPVLLDETSLNHVGAARFEQVHPGLPWIRQFEHARAIGLGGQVQP